MKQFEVKWEKDELGTGLEKLTTKEKEVFLDLLDKGRTIKKKLIVKFSTTLEMKVIKMDECLRGCNEIFKSKDGFEIFSRSYPEISENGNKIFVRGSDRNGDEAVTSRSFRNAKAAGQFVQKALTAVEEFNETRYEDKIKEEYGDVLSKLSSKDRATFIALARKMQSDEKGLEISFEICISAEIVQMDECLRGTTDAYVASNGISFHSASYPELIDNEFYLRGEMREADNKVLRLRFADPYEAAEFIKNIKDAIAEFNADFMSSIN